MTKHILMLGQSNAVGVDGGYLSDIAIDHRVSVWNNGNGGTGRIAGTAYVRPALGSNPFNPTAGAFKQNMGVWFASRLAHYTGEDVKFMLVAKGSTAIDEYDDRNGNHPLWDEIIDNWDLSENPAADILIHCGHESSRNDVDYIDKQEHIISRLKAEGIIKPSAIIIMTALAEGLVGHKNCNDSILRPWAGTRGDVYFVESAGLPQHSGSHFFGQGLVELGCDRMWNEVGHLFTQGAMPDGVVDMGYTSQGEWVKYENGRLEIKAHLMLTRYNASMLTAVWNFPVPFVKSTPAVHVTAGGVNNAVNVGFAKEGASRIRHNTVSLTNAQVQMVSNGLYTSGDEQYPVTVTATGWWN